MTSLTECGKKTFLRYTKWSCQVILWPFQTIKSRTRGLIWYDRRRHAQLDQGRAFWPLPVLDKWTPVSLHMLKILRKRQHEPLWRKWLLCNMVDWRKDGGLASAIISRLWKVTMKGCIQWNPHYSRKKFHFHSKSNSLTHWATDEWMGDLGFSVLLNCIPVDRRVILKGYVLGPSLRR